MRASIPAPLERLDSHELYRMLGEAWCAQLKPEPGKTVYLPALSEIGKLDYETVSPRLRSELKKSNLDEIITVVAAAVQQHASWRMPATVVAALAIKNGLAEA